LTRADLFLALLDRLLCKIIPSARMVPDEDDNRRKEQMQDEAGRIETHKTRLREMRIEGNLNLEDQNF